MEYTVTLVKQLTAKRKLVYINYEPAFALYTSELRKFEIKEQETVTEDTYNEIISVLSKRAAVRAMNLLKSKDYSKAELVRKLNDGHYPEEAVEYAISYVESYGYIDDYRYASNYVAFKADVKSRKQITCHLREKGIASDIIENVCQEYYQDNENAEFDNIVAGFEKKLLKFTEEPSYEDKQKLLGYYYRKGFPTDTIRKALDIVVDKLYNN